jgi:hypothetical protein
MAEWPDWNPPEEMIVRQPYMPRFMADGETNPLGARALYLGNTVYRIHGTNQPSTIGTFVSSGCIRLTNEDVMDLYSRVKVGTRVVVLPGRPPAIAAATSLPPRPNAAGCDGTMNIQDPAPLSNRSPSFQRNTRRSRVRPRPLAMVKHNGGSLLCFANCERLS